MTCCPVCGGIVAKFTVSFHAEFTMCSNEDCTYPFEDNAVFKTSVHDKRPPSGHNLAKKRKTTTAPNGVNAVDTKLRIAKKSKSTDITISKTLENSLSAVPSKSDLSPVCSNSDSDTTIQRFGILLPPSKPTQPTKYPAQVVNPFSLSSIPSTTSSSSSSPTIQHSMPASPEGMVPDLVFDFLPAGGWITPVTPPDNPTSTDILTKTSTTGSAPITTNSLETLLFDEDFDIDFGSLQNINPALEFDADFEAMLNQQL
ncbi:hypothetical protein BGZ76_000578 [Entomortierella beljakovae]|nr:hypothetical protein BGZ76_000578 [Entomortierella beljakovae]